MNNSRMKFELGRRLPESMQCRAAEAHQRGSSVYGCARARTLRNPHPGRAQAAVFQKAAEGNYKLGRCLDGEAALRHRGSAGPARVYAERTMTQSTSL